MEPMLVITNSGAGTADDESLDAALEVLRSEGEVEVAATSSLDELDEVLGLADRIAVMYRGRIVGVVDGADADRDMLGLMMAGVPMEDARRQAAEHHSVLGEADRAQSPGDAAPAAEAPHTPDPASPEERP